MPRKTLIEENRVLFDQFVEKFKKEKEKEFRKEAEKGCFINGNRPKKKVVERYIASEEYKAHLEELKDGDLQYQAIISGHADGNEEICAMFAERLDALREEEERKEAEELIGSAVQEAYCSNPTIMHDFYDDVLWQCEGEVEEYFANEVLHLPEYNPYGYRKRRHSYAELCNENFEEFLSYASGDSGYGDLEDDIYYSVAYESVPDQLVEKAIETNDILRHAKSKLKNKFISDLQEEISSIYEDEIYEMASDVCSELQKKFTKERIAQLIRKNPHYRFMMQERDRKAARDRMLQDNLLKAIPDNYVDLYPAVRKTKRKFVFHIGPTNSGKTYQAMQALRKAGSGAYLGPLRLLAYEQFEAMNADGYPCSLWTGEERINVDGASFVASTIEMADFSNHHKLVVVDEAQMLADEDRGGAWTAVLLGIDAEEIHVCASDDAEDILCRIVTDCGDDYEIVRHQRQTPLIAENTGVNFPKSVQKGDAYIVFSRKNVHAVAAELQHKGYKTSIIYGALPYDVRHEEARKFNDGETDVVVATDAIGMGLNMPIRRVVFLEAKKFDGKADRMLSTSEVKQIAGRAGRFGIYEEGYVAGDVPVHKTVTKKLDNANRAIEKAAVAFPEQLIGMDAKLSEILTKWKEVAVQKGYIKTNVDREIALAETLEAETEDKRLIYEMITVPFDEKNGVLLALWEKLCLSYIDGDGVVVGRYIPSAYGGDNEESALKILEQQYKICDLLYFFSERFGADEESIGEISNCKQEISKQIMTILKKQRLVGKTCNYCGRHLAWNYPYGMCEKCHDEMYNYRYQPWDDDY